MHRHHQCLFAVSISIASATVQAGGIAVRQNTLPDVPGSLSSTTVPRGINGAGNISGYASTPASPVNNGVPGSIGFIWNPSTASYSTIDIGAYEFTSAYGINDSGVVVGDYAIAPQPTGGFAGFIYDSNTGIVNTSSQIRYRGISSAGDLTGKTVPQPDGSELGYRKFQGKEETFSCFNAHYTIGESINTAGDVVGTYSLHSLSFGFTGAFLYHNGQCTDISVPGANYSAAWAINDFGDVVGQYSKRLSYGNFFLHDGKLDLDRFTKKSTGLHRKLLSLVSINNDRIVTGQGSDVDSEIPAYYGRIISLGDRTPQRQR